MDRVESRRDTRDSPFSCYSSVALSVAGGRTWAVSRVWTVSSYIGIVFLPTSTQLAIAHATHSPRRMSRATLSGRLSPPLSNEHDFDDGLVRLEDVFGVADQAMTDSHTSTSLTTPTSSPIYSTQDSRPGYVAMSRFGEKH